MTTSISRQSPIAHAIVGAPKKIASTLSHPSDLVKLGVKGPAIASWARQLGIDLPTKLYDMLSVDEQSSLVRVGGEEIILECRENNSLLVKIEDSFRQPTPGVYRIEQQSATFDLKGDLALGVLAQTCGVDPMTQPVDRIFYTRVAGVSCGIIVRDVGGQRIYRLWVDYTLAPYLWETLAEIIGQM